MARSADEARPFEAAWRRLASSTLDRNVFFEEWQLLPALEQLVGDAPSGVEIVFIFRNLPNGEVAELCAVLPLERGTRDFRGLRLNALKLWQHRYCYLCTPLVSRTDALGIVSFFLAWLGSEQADCRMMEFNGIAGDGGFAKVLDDALTSMRRPVWETGRHERALLELAADASTFMDRILSPKKKKELRRLERRLAELGALTADSLAPDADVDPWIQEFLAIENSGWKGGEASALAAHTETQVYFERIVRSAQGRGQLEMHALRLDGRAIAMKCNFISQHAAWAFKIAFDEAFAKYSPGVLLEIENIERAHRQSRFEWMDSCAAPDHPMIDHLWPASRVIASRTVATGRWLSNTMISTLSGVQAVKRKASQFRKETT